jgi:deoxycytidylate deaminase
MIQSTGKEGLRQIYTKAKKLALSNGRDYHVAAILKRNGRIIKIGENTSKTHPRFKRQPGDELEVIRFRKSDHVWTMAKPCSTCLREIERAGIKSVRYTNWKGEWEQIKIR